MHNKKTVILIDDDPTLLEMYQFYINSFDDYELVGSYQSADEALKKYKNLFPDIIISDISMPGTGGIDAVSKFRELDANVKIIIISVHDEMDYILNSFKSNVDGYITKPIDKRKLLGALQSLESNGAPLSSDISRKVINLFKKEKNEMFSKRENDIIALFAQGYTYKTIAEKLFVSSSTVNFHIQNIYCKLNVNNKSDALKILRSNKDFSL